MFSAQPRIETSTEKKLIGTCVTMSLVNYKAAELWGSFMPRRKEIIKTVNNDLTSMTIYDASYFNGFKPTNEFEKWAAIEVSDFSRVPSGLATFTLPIGLYAVFNYKGLSTDHSIFQYIFGTWIPNSNYVVDSRPHFEILGKKFKNNDPNSEEEIWIPIKLKGL